MNIPKTKPAFLAKIEQAQPFEALKTGDQLPEMWIIADSEGGKLRLSDLITDHMILVLASITCAPCERALEAIDQYTQQCTDRNIVLLIDAPFKDVEVIRSAYQSRVRIYPSTYLEMRQKLRMRFMPSGFAIDTNGNILSDQIINGLEEFVYLVQPTRSGTVSNASRSDA